MPSAALFLALDPVNHDLYLDPNFQIAMTTDIRTAVAQAIRCVLQTVQGESPLAPLAGIPMFDQVLIKNPNLATLQHLFATAIAKVEGVAQVISVNLKLNSATRILTVNFVVRATNGTVVQGST